MRKTIYEKNWEAQEKMDIEINKMKVTVMKMLVEATKRLSQD